MSQKVSFYFEIQPLISCLSRWALCIYVKLNVYIVCKLLNDSQRDGSQSAAHTQRDLNVYESYRMWHFILKPLGSRGATCDSRKQLCCVNIDEFYAEYVKLHTLMSVFCLLTIYCIIALCERNMQKKVYRSALSATTEIKWYQGVMELSKNTQK